MRVDFPFSAIVGQEDLKLALLLVAVDPTIGGVLISGERGTAKSTAARGIAALLPPHQNGGAAAFVELPLGATEDRVVGSLNIAEVLKDGSTVLRSGLLARADGGMLYVDEVNLLPDHLVDLLLDAAASGWVTVERDGVSAGEAARFMLVGTMNPEEGELRPQFLDRFGLCVQVRGLKARDTRMAAVRQRLAFDAAPAHLIGAARPAEQALREKIVAVRERLTTLAISEAHLALVAALTMEQQLDGIRGDLALIKAARALAAWQGDAQITEEHIRRAAPLALAHRARRQKSSPASRAARYANPPEPGTELNEAVAVAATTLSASIDTVNPPAGAPTNIGAATLATDLIDRERSGRRGGDSRVSRRVIGTVAFQQTGTLALSESLVVAANRGVRFGGGAVRLAASDLLQHQRSGPGISHVLFLVDASGSMTTQRRLEVAKGAALGLLASSYQHRDQVALMVFRAAGTDLVLPFTRHVGSVEQALMDVPTGGRTPLAKALRDAAVLLQTRDPALLVLMTDGRANVSTEGGDPWTEALDSCAALQAACAGALVVDCERGPIVLGRARLLAQALGAECVALEDLDGTELTLRIARRLELP